MPDPSDDPFGFGAFFGSIGSGGESLGGRAGGGPGGGGLGVAVSGGSDSLGLLIALQRWGGAGLAVATVDHGLRPEAAAEAAQVRGVCDRLGLPHDTLAWDGAGGGNLADRARRARYRLLADWASARGLGVVALGHTLDDQAETVVMRLGRASGVDGLSGMAPRIERHGVCFARPLLGVRRQALRALLETVGVGWIEDPTNDDPASERVRVRAALPALEALGIAPEALAQTALNLASARAALAGAAADAARRIARAEAGDVVLVRAGLAALPDETRRRLVAGALRFVGGGDHPPRRVPLADALDAIAAGRRTTLHGCLLTPAAGEVRITRETAAVAALTCPTSALWDGRWRLVGPHSPALRVGALGAALDACPDRRGISLPRASLMATPAIREGDRLVSAPLAGLANGWTAEAPGLGHFVAQLLAH